MVHGDEVTAKQSNVKLKPKSKYLSKPSLPKPPQPRKNVLRFRQAPLPGDILIDPTKTHCFASSVQSTPRMIGKSRVTRSPSTKSNSRQNISSNTSMNLASRIYDKFK